MTVKARFTAKGNVELKMDVETAKNLMAVLNRSGSLLTRLKIIDAQHENASEQVWSVMSHDLDLGESEYTSEAEEAFWKS